MHSYLVPLTAVLSFGCAATPTVTLHVESARTQRLAPEVLRPLEETARAGAVEIENDLTHANERVARAESALHQASTEPHTAEIASVRAAKIERAKRDLAWQKTLVDVARWRAVVASAADELAKAKLVSRTGQDIDVQAFSEQHGRLHLKLTELQHRATIERARFEESERRLATLKQQVAQSRPL